MAHEITSDEVSDLIEEASSKESFDVLEFVRGAAQPTKSVIVYTDANAAMHLYQFYEAEEERKEFNKNLDSFSLGDDIDLDFEESTEEELAQWRAELEASGLIFEMRGLAPSAAEAIEKKLKSSTKDDENMTDEKFYEVLQNKIIAASIVSVSTSDGRKNEDKWDADKVSSLMENIYSSEATKLANTALELTYVGALFDRVVSADF